MADEHDDLDEREEEGERVEADEPEEADQRVEVDEAEEADQREEADEHGEADSRGSSPEPPSQRALPLESTTKFRIGADAALIELVRAQPVLYDPTHARYMDSPLKNALWTKIGKQLRTSPNACKARWNNIRDNYRKSLRRRSKGGTLQYKFAYMLTFMDAFYKGQLDSGEPAKIRGRKIMKDISEDSNASTEDDSEKKPQTTIHYAESDAYAASNQSESGIDIDMFDKSANVSGSFTPAHLPSYPSQAAQSNAVDAFLAAISPSLKCLSPYHLSLAKAEIFATVHKYELKGIVGNSWAPGVVIHCTDKERT